MSDIYAKLKTLSGVEEATIMTKDGAVIDSSVYEREVLAANGLFLSMFVGKVGGHYGVGEFKSASVHGTDHHLILLNSKQHYLCVSAAGKSKIGEVESEIRKILTNK